MSQEILIIGESGSGKSASLENLNPKTTFLFNVVRKPMPFRGWKTKWQALSKENPQGNYMATDNPKTICATMKHINENMPHITTIIIDDFQYIMANEFMRRAHEKGFEKFTDIGLHAWEIITLGKSLREDLTFVVLGHAEVSTDLAGGRRLKFKTIGKLVDDKINVEGLFTVVLFTHVGPDENNKIEYLFKTQTDGSTTGKSPKGMFESEKIPNDLEYVIKTVTEYNNS
jgi:hypothetical protein